MAKDAKQSTASYIYNVAGWQLTKRRYSLDDIFAGVYWFILWSYIFCMETHTLFDCFDFNRELVWYIYENKKQTIFVVRSLAECDWLGMFLIVNLVVSSGIHTIAIYFLVLLSFVQQIFLVLVTHTNLARADVGKMLNVWQSPNMLAENHRNRFRVPAPNI